MTTTKVEVRGEKPRKKTAGGGGGELSLSDDQRAVYDAVLDWLSRGEHILTLGGYGGTGKTTLVAALAQAFASRGLTVAYVAFTGRASSVLARKLKEAGVSTDDRLYEEDKGVLGGRFGHLFSSNARTSFSGTIHRLLYKPIINVVTDELLGWRKREELDRRYNLIVCDEASMVSDEILHDMASHGTRLLAVGDHGQLPPVMAPGELMKRPHLRLEKIHRQAEGNPIIALAAHVRNRGRLADFRLPPGGPIGIVRKSEIGPRLASAYAAVEGVGGAALLDVGLLCWRNATRVTLNGVARKALGRTGPPKKNEVVVCLKNEMERGVMNGMRGILTADAVVGPDDSDVWRSPWIVEAPVAFPSEGLPERPFKMCAPQFTRAETFKSVDELRTARVDVQRVSQAGSLFAFGYAMTCHKFQGSQAAHVLVFLDRPERPDDEDYRRWMYTAVSRAAEKLTIFV